MNINNLPVPTFNRMGMNGTTIDYAPANVRSVEINDSGVICFDSPEDVELRISIKKACKATVVLEYKHSDTLNIETKVSLESGANLKLIQIDCGRDGARLINRISSDLGQAAELNLVQIYPGCSDVYGDCQVELRGDESLVTIDTAHLTREKKIVDLNFVTNHWGKMTKSNLHIDGAVRENGEKTVRDTIDFKKGAKGAEGKENEKVYLLAEDVVNKSIPIILCSEEDVAGSHGAAIGSLDEDMLFYLATRNIDEEEAKRMMTYANLARLLRFIDDEEIRERTDSLILENI